MKKAVFVLILAVACLSANSAFAQGNIHLRANVPFDFSVDGRQYAAGQYDLVARNANGVILRNEKTGQAVQLPLLSPDMTGEAAHLQFATRGAHAVLRSITDAEGHSWLVPVSRNEKKLEMAPKIEQNAVTVALK